GRPPSTDRPAPRSALAGPDRRSAGTRALETRGDTRPDGRRAPPDRAARPSWRSAPALRARGPGQEPPDPEAVGAPPRIVRADCAVRSSARTACAHLRSRDV